MAVGRAPCEARSGPSPSGVRSVKEALPPPAESAEVDGSREGRTGQVSPPARDGSTGKPDAARTKSGPARRRRRAPTGRLRLERSRALARDRTARRPATACSCLAGAAHTARRLGRAPSCPRRRPRGSHRRGGGAQGAGTRVGSRCVAIQPGRTSAAGISRWLRRAQGRRSTRSAEMAPVVSQPGPGRAGRRRGRGHRRRGAPIG